MTTTKSLNQKIAEEQQKIFLAQQAEAARLDAEQQHKREAAAATERLRVLQGEQLAENWNTAKAKNTDLVSANDAAYAELYKALNAAADAFKFNVGNAPKAVIDTFTAQQRHADRAVSAQAQARTNPDNHFDSVLTADGFYAQLPNALSLDNALALWISQARDDQEERLRQGIAFVIAGDVLNGRGFDARTANDAMINGRRRAGVGV